MKLFERAAMWAFASIALTAMAFAAGQNLPAGDGKDVVEKTCTTCHDVGPISKKTEDKEGWTDIVKSMQSYGAQVSDKDFLTIVTYLTKAYGKGGAPAAGAQSDPVAAKAADDAGLPAGAGRELVATKCQACHDLENIKAKKADAAEWKGTIGGMVSYGAQLTDPEVTTVSEYLAKAFPK